MMRLTVPGNLLLLGEYAVLEAGGLGFALAPEKRLVLTAAPGRGFQITGTWLGKSVKFGSSTREKRREGSPLLTAIVETCTGWLKSHGRARCLESHITIDSSAFFETPDIKSGYGSSAAVAVGLTSALLKLGGLTGGKLQAATLNLALSAHRKTQGGRGSGYDIYTSFFGGMGFFKGGKEPEWTACRLPWMPPLYLFHGDRNVSTSDAVKEYSLWKETRPEEARRFLVESNESVKSFLRSTSWEDAAPRFAHCKGIALMLGREIGVEAAINPPGELDFRRYKALGAGNEIGVYISSDPPSQDDAFERLVVSGKGIVWES